MRVRHIHTAFRMTTLSTTRAIAVGALTALLFAAPQAARANGRYPLANQLVIDPGDPGHLVVRTTFGILESHDSGVTFGWICETLIGSLGSTEDPAIAVTAGGTTLAASSVGLSTSADGGCSWRAAPGLADGRFGIDVAVVLSIPMRRSPSSRRASVVNTTFTWSRRATTGRAFKTSVPPCKE